MMRLNNGDLQVEHRKPIYILERINDDSSKYNDTLDELRIQVGQFTGILGGTIYGRISRNNIL